MTEMDKNIEQSYRQSEQLEAARMSFMETDRGHAAALAFARQTRNSYRRAVVTRTAPAGDSVFRLRLIASYCYLKRYIAASEDGA
jgi:hypothetical protein